ncbi:MAG: hypothetical protein L3J56_08620, partial [Bacteroidales bacterium]|nr:hypothetical protein [Bacteroidales bacterium]
TFTRLIEIARKKVADFLINGKSLHFEGGNIHFKKNILKCETCGYSFHISFNRELKHCPHCGSEKLINLAGGFGHGRCCVD